MWFIPVWAAELPEIPQSPYVIALSPPSIGPKIAPESTLDGFCVSFVQQNGYGHLRGNAHEWVKYVNSEEPLIGSVVVLDEGKFGHLALVEDFDRNTIEIIEQNYEGRWIVSRRIIKRDYPRMLGFVKP